MAARTVTKVQYVDNETVIRASNLNAIQDAINDHASLIDGLDTNKVSKVAGKGLSTNDFTNDAQSKLSGLPTGTDLDTTLETKVDKRTSGTEVYMHNATTQGGATLTETPTAGAVPLYGTGGVLKAAAPVADNDVVRKAELDDVKDNLNAVSVTNTVSGAIASFSDGADNVPVKSLVVNIEPVQKGTGDPSPDNIRPISGWTGAEIEGCGKNLLPTWTSTSGKGYSSYIPVDFDKNPSYVFSCTVGTDVLRTMFFAYDAYKNQIARTTGTDAQIREISKTSFSSEVTGDINNIAFIRTNFYGSSMTADMIKNGNCQVEIGSTPTDYEPYTGKEISVTFPSSAGTVYGATLTINPDRTGSLVVDRAILTAPTVNSIQQGSTGIYSASVSASQFAGKNADKLMSNKYKSVTAIVQPGDTGIRNTAEGVYIYDDAFAGKTEAQATEMLADLQIVYSLATPITYTLMESEISGILETLYGTNNIWADCGDSTVEYTADTKLFIEQLTQPTENDMTADHAISAGTFFMIGNTLYLATSQIAAGATITPGTNATKLSLADALNQLNT